MSQEKQESREQERGGSISLLHRLSASRRSWAIMILVAALMISLALIVRVPKQAIRAADGDKREPGRSLEHAGHDHSHEDTDEEHPAGVVVYPIEQQWLIKLKQVPVEQATVAPQISATGRVIPAKGHQVILASPVGGIITGGLLPRVGQRVSKGQTLAVLRQQITAAEAAQIAAANAQLQIEQARLNAERKRLTQEVEQTRAEYDLTVVALDHANKLYARKAYSVHQQLEAKAKRQSAEASYRSAVQQLEALNRAELPTPDARRKQVSYELTAPISGTIVKVHKAEGEQAAAGQPVLEIVNLETVWIEAPIFERDLFRLSRTVGATFTTPAYPDAQFKGRLVDIGAVIDEQTRAATALFEVPNAGRTLLIGMQANVRLDIGSSGEALLIPRSAVLENEGRKMVFVVLTGEEFEPREVTLGAEYGDRVVALSGLRAGERVVTQGAYQLRLRQLRPAGGEEGDEHHHHHDH